MKYEYMIKVNHFDLLTEEWLNYYGEQSWELIFMIIQGTGYHYHFKREL